MEAMRQRLNKNKAIPANDGRNHVVLYRSAMAFAKKADYATLMKLKCPSDPLCHETAIERTFDHNDPEPALPEGHKKRDRWPSIYLFTFALCAECFSMCKEVFQHARSIELSVRDWLTGSWTDWLNE
eukprot:GHVU01209968.1.p2 GENE.GHVU01209968.1~~GHVU01209968.1.p2  ORF type:complete len:127 (-),score=10.61 GHVU01209968.1:2826-3206(-)